MWVFTVSQKKELFYLNPTIIYHHMNKHFNPAFCSVLFCRHNFLFRILTQNTFIFQDTGNSTESSVINNDDIWQPRMREVSMKLITIQYYVIDISKMRKRVSSVFQTPRSGLTNEAQPRFLN